MNPFIITGLLYWVVGFANGVGNQTSPQYQAKGNDGIGTKKDRRIKRQPNSADEYCLTNKCLNGGHCDLQCYCGSRYTGTHCETPITNIALNKPAFQSTTDGRYLADLAVDGNTHTDFNAGVCTNTRVSGESWWAVDLEYTYTVYYTKVTNTDAMRWQYLRGFKLLVTDDNPSTYTPAYDQFKSPCVKHDPPIPRGISKEIHCYAGNNIGRYVLIIKQDTRESLSVCEVEVYGAVETKANTPTTTKSSDAKTNTGKKIPPWTIAGVCFIVLSVFVTGMVLALIQRKQKQKFPSEPM